MHEKLMKSENACNTHILHIYYKTKVSNLNHEILCVHQKVH